MFEKTGVWCVSFEKTGVSRQILPPRKFLSRLNSTQSCPYLRSLAYFLTRQLICFCRLKLSLEGANEKSHNSFGSQCHARVSFQRNRARLAAVEGVRTAFAVATLRGACSGRATRYRSSAASRWRERPLHDALTTFQAENFQA